MTLTLLSACGGGSGSQSSPVAANDSRAEGAYVGTSDVANFGLYSRGNVFRVVVLEDGQVWLTYGLGAPNQFGAQFGTWFTPDGFMAGTSQPSAGRIATFSMKDYQPNVTPAASLNVTGTYDQLQSASLALSIEGYPSILGNTPATDSYQYSASTPSVLGGTSWNMRFVRNGFSPMTGSLAFSTDGKISGLFGNCSLLGQFQLRASGKNVYDVSLDGYCFGLQNVKGIATVNTSLYGGQQVTQFIGTLVSSAVGQEGGVLISGEH
jgi:hypothetical protein